MKYNKKVNFIFWLAIIDKVFIYHVFSPFTAQESTCINFNQGACQQIATFIWAVLYADSDGITLSADKKKIFEKKEEKKKKNIRTKWTGFIRWRTGLIRRQTGLTLARIKPVCWRIKPVRWRIKPVQLVLIFSLKLSIILLLCLFLLVF